MKSLNYIGSKRSLIDFLSCSIKDVIPERNWKSLSFCDLFAGTGIVGFTIGRNFRKVIANDLEYYSFVINKALYITFTTKLDKCISKLNDLVKNEHLLGEELITKNYSEPRLFFTKENARRIDVIRTEIDKMKSSSQITQDEFYFLLGSLLVSADKVANTASVYGAFLKKFKASALKPMILEPLHDNIEQIDNIVLNCDANNIDTDHLDVVYLDPPYNQRQYGANYSPLNYIAIYNNNVEVKGKTGLIDNYNKSAFCKKKGLKELFDNLVSILVKKSTKYIFISYNNEGLLSCDELREVLEKYGKVELKTRDYKRFKSSTNEGEMVVQEYLWCLCIN